MELSQEQFRKTRSDRLQDDEFCHICGCQLEAGDVWGYCDTVEHYGDGQVGAKIFRTQWHIDCHYLAVTAREPN